MADELKIKVTSEADTSGLDNTTQAGQKVEQQLTAAGAAATKAGEQIATASTQAAAATTQAAAAQGSLAQAAGGISDAGIRELILAVGILMDQAASAGVTFDRMEQHLARMGQQGSQALRPVANHVREVKERLSEAEHEAEHFIAAIRAGVGIDIGHRIVETVSELPAKFREAIQEGVRFNAEMETVTVSLAGAFRAADPTHYLNFDQARVAGSTALDALREKANELGLDTHALAEGLSINLRGLAEGGIRDIKQQIDIITTLNQAAQSKGLQGNQASRDIIDLLNGRANRTLFGAELGIKDEDVKAAREAGTLYEFLTQKLSAYKEAGQEAANTFAAAEQRLKNETEQLYGEIAKPIFAALKDAYAGLSAEITKPEVAQSLRALGYDLATVVDGGAALAEFAIRNAGLLITLGGAVGVVSFALAAYKAAQIASVIGTRLTALVAETEATAAQTAAIKADTTAIEENTAAKVASNAVPVGGGGAGAAEAGAGGLLAKLGLGAAGESVAVGEAGAAAIGGTALLGALPGLGIWALRQHGANQLGAADQDAGEYSLATSTRFQGLENDIARSTDPEAQEKARRALRQELDDQRKELAEMQKAEAGVNAQDIPQAAANYDPSRAGKIEALQQYVQLLDAANERAAKLAGTNPLAGDPKEQDKKKALEDYHQSAEYELAQARESGDSDRVAKAEHRVAVEKEIDRLTTKQGLGSEDAAKEAERMVAANELSKETAKLDTLMESVGRKAERQKTAAELTTDAIAKTAAILGQLPPDRAAALGASPDAGAVATAVQALPQGTDAEVEGKRTLLKLTAELLALAQARDAAAKREKTQQEKDAKEAEEKAKNLKQTQDVIAAEKEQTAILEARGRGQKDVADALEKERDIRLEILRLQNAGVGYEEARVLATDKVNAANAASDEKQEERDQRHRERREREHHPEHRRGERETFTIHGYSDPNQDKAGGLHTGGLQTGGLSTGNLGGSGGSTAADALANAPTNVSGFRTLEQAAQSPRVAARLADAKARAELNQRPGPTAVRGILSLDDQIAGHYAPGSHLVRGLQSLDQRIGGAPTATASIGPLGTVGGAAATPAASAGTGDNGHRAVTDAAQQAARATRDTTSATRALSSALASLFAEQRRELEEQRRELQKLAEDLKGRLENRS